MAARLKARPELLGRRRETVEHPFGSIKQWTAQRRARARRYPISCIVSTRSV
jgi:hypothetical protein